MKDQKNARTRSLNPTDFALMKSSFFWELLEKNGKMELIELQKGEIKHV